MKSGQEGMRMNKMCVIVGDAIKNGNVRVMSLNKGLTYFYLFKKLNGNDG